MKKRLQQNLYMLEATVHFAERTASETQTLAPFGETTQRIKSLIDGYRLFGITMTPNITGYSDTKNDKRQLLVEKINTIVPMALAFATQTENRILLKKVKYTSTRIQQMRNADLILVGESLHSNLVEYVSELSTYLITQTDLDELLAACNEFSLVSSEPVYEKGVKHVSLLKAENAIKQALTIVKQELDKLAMGFKKFNQSWYQEYRVSRKVLDLASNPTQIKGVVVNSREVGIYGVNIVARKGDELFSCDTDIQGNFHIKDIKPGVYSMTIYKPGYKSFETEYFQVKLGQSSIVNTMLQSELSELKIAS